MKTKFLSALLAATMMILLLVACQNSTPVGSETGGNEKPSTQEETAPPAPGSEPQLEIPEGTRYDGYTFTVLTCGNYNECFRLEVEDYSADLIDSAAYQRNADVEALLGVTVKAIPESYPDENVYPELSAAVMSEAVCPYDLVFPHCMLGVSAIMSEGLLYDWNTLSGVDFSKPWWNQSMSEHLAIADHLYIVSSDLCVAWQGMYCFLFNKDVLEERTNLKSADLYQAVYDGNWTLDYMTSLVKESALTGEVNGDGLMDANDRYGLTIPPYTANRFMYGSGITTTELDENGKQVLSLFSTKTVDLCQKVYDLYHLSSTYVDSGANYNPGPFQECDTFRMLTEGRVLLAGYDIGSYPENIRYMDNVELGLLPIPKYNENQTTYYSLCAAGIFGMPKNVGDAERNAVITEALSYYSYKNVRPAYFDQTLQYKVLDDEDSYNVLRIMHEGKLFDFGYNFGYSAGNPLLGDCFNTIINDLDGGNFTAYYDSVKDSYQAMYDDLYNAIVAADGR